ncbi:hypothetical protein EJB05_37271, partial [Eragrostis curvula]
EQFKATYQQETCWRCCQARSGRSHKFQRGEGESRRWQTRMKTQLRKAGHILHCAIGTRMKTQLRKVGRILHCVIGTRMETQMKKVGCLLHTLIGTK